jgi:hypothetical protein
MSVFDLNGAAMGQNRQHRSGLPPLILGLVILVLPSCSGDSLVRPTEGSILISTSTTGSDPDPDGYSVTVDNQPEQAVDTRDTLVINNLDPGDHSVTITGVIQNCAVGGSGQRTVNVIPGDTVNVTFRISCDAITPPPPPGGDPRP